MSRCGHVYEEDNMQCVGSEAGALSSPILDYCLRYTPRTVSAPLTNH